MELWQPTFDTTSSVKMKKICLVQQLGVTEYLKILSKDILRVKLNQA